MDPLSLSASIAGLISIADMVAGRSYNYIKEARGASKEVRKLLEEITSLFGILNSLRLVASRYEEERFDSTMQSQHIHTCHTLLEKIKERLDKADPSHVDEKKSQFRQKASTLGRTLIWPFSSAETKGLIAEVGKQKATLSLALAADGMTTLIEALSQQKAQGKDIAEIRDSLRVQRAEQTLFLLSSERRRMLDTIGPYDPSRHQNIAIKLRQPGTGVWFTEGVQFQTWLSTRNAKMWLYGIPGAGKTVLTSSIVQAANNQSEQSNGIAFFYCDYKDSKTHDPLVILGALIRQLAIQDTRCLAKLEEFSRSHYPEPGSQAVILTTPGDFCELLQTMSTYFDDVMIIIDALDECGSARSHVVELLASLNNGGQTNIKTLFTSRLETDIEVHLQDYEKISIAATSSDLKLYVASEIESRSRKGALRTRNQGLKKEIMDRLVEGAEGMFRWVACQLDYLCELNTDKQLRKALNSLPPTLFSTYERILDRVNASNEDTQQLVQRVLTWIICSREPLSTKELLQAVSISEGDTKLDLEAMPDEEGILKWCSSLVRKTPDGDRLELAHFTVEEFLLAIDSNAQKSSYAKYRISLADQDLSLAKLCLTYILFDDFRDKDWTGKDGFNEFIEGYEFFHYASKYWYQHAENHRDNEGLLDLAQILFDPSKTNNFLHWSHYWTWSITEIPKNKVIDLSNTETLHFAACLSLYAICEWLIEEKGREGDLDKLSSIGTPVFCALAGDHLFIFLGATSDRAILLGPERESDKVGRKRTLESLLEAGAQVSNTRLHPVHDWSPLSFALIIDFCWDILLERGALVDDVCLEVVQSGGTEKFILGVGDKNLSDDMRSKYINLALEMEDTRQRAVDMMSKTRALKIGDSIEGASALGKAAFIGQVQVVRELLRRPDIEIDFRDPKAGSSAALHDACESGHMEIIKLLVDHGATIDITDKWELTPFLVAAEMKSLEVVRYLVEKGADINRVTKAGLTSLHLAAMGNSVLILEHLLSSPKLTHTISTKSNDGRVPLFCAVNCGSLDTARFLLERSGPTDILGKTDDGHTCLHYAVISGKPKLVSLLQDSGICHYDQTEEGFTALHYAVKSSNRDLLCALLDHIDRITLGIHSPFAHPAIVDTSAIRQTRQGAWTVQDFGSKRFLDLPSRSGKTAMQILVSADPFTNEHKEMFVDLASCVGIDLENPDGEKRTPLVSLASRLSNNPDNPNFHSALRALLELGVDANAKDRTGRTALHYLCGARTFTPIMYQAIADFIIGKEWTAESLLNPLPLPGAPIGPPPPPPPGIRLPPLLSKKNHVLPKSPGPPPPPPPPPPTVSVTRVIWENVSGTARVDIPDQSKETALQAFFRSMNRMQNSNQPTEIALRLLELSPKGELDCQLPDGNQLFNTVIINKNDKLIMRLYDLGINTQYRDSTLNLRSPLELFCIWGARDLKVFKKLISNCKNLSELDIKGLSLLHLACDYGHLKVVRELLDSGIDVNIESRDGTTALSYAVAHGHTSIVELLLENGATVQADIASRDWKTCLLNRVSNATICRLLDDRGINDWTERSSCTFESIYIPDFSTSRPCGQNGDQRISRLLTRLTPLHYVAFMGRLDVFKYVVEHVKDVNLNIEAEFGITPLFFAILTQRQALVTFLLEHGAKVNATYYPRRWTMLHLAAFIGDKWIALELLSNGADPCATDSSSLTPSIIALQVGHLELSSTLQDEEKTRKPESKSRSSKSEEAIDQKISPALTDAIIRGDLELCQRLVERGFYIDGTCECGCTPLLKAYAHNRREIASYLLTIGASVEGLTCDGEYDNVGFSALHCAASMGDEKILEAIIERASYITEKGPQAFRIAACLGHVKILQLLFSHMDDPKSLLEARSDGTAAVKNYDRLYWASQIGTEIGQGTSLHFAAMYNRIEAVEFLLRAGADLEARDEEGLTALQHSIERCDSTDVTELLVSAGANISTRDREGLTPLMRAARRGTLASLKIILSKYDEEVLHARDRWGKTALHHAIEDCQLSAAKELVKLGAQVNILDYAGISPLQSAIVNHQSQFVLENLPRIDTYFSERYGSLLNMAVSRKNTEVVMELLKRVPDEKMDRYVNLNCELGTPLYASASLGNISIMEELLAKGAMVNIVGGPLGTPLMGACEMDQMEAVSFLLKKGAKLECVKPNGAKITAEQAARKNDYTQLILQRFKEKGGEAFDEKIPTKKADVEKMDETLRILKERKEERRNQIVISDSDTDSNTDSDGNDNTDGDTGDEKAGDGKTDEEKDLEKDLEKDE